MSRFIMTAKPFDWQFPYPSQRMPVMAKNAVATSQPLAAQAGLRMMLKGGNAVDAILATAITLTVVEPTSNGIGSDAFCILWDGSNLHGLNASGRSPAAWNLDRYKGHKVMPTRGWDAVTVPGAVSAWVELSKRFGKLPFADLFEPAIRYAADGYMVSPTISRLWAKQATSPATRNTSCRTGAHRQPGRNLLLLRTPGRSSASPKPGAKHFTGVTSLTRWRPIHASMVA
jgi:gamma-glutamyltranspeptidase/glutathione hydrolase